MALRDWLARLTGRSADGVTGGQVFVWLPPDEPDPLRYGIKPVGSEEELNAELRWLNAIENPFGQRLLDCRSVTRGMISTAQDQATLDRYIRLRSDTGESLRDQHAPSVHRISCKLNYPCEPRATALPNGRRFVSLRLEYKWDIAHWDGALLFTRSWTGDLVYRTSVSIAPGDPAPGILSVTEIEIADDGTGGSNMGDDFHIAAVDFLAQTYLLQRIVPHPLPEWLSGAPERTLALWSLQQFGCDARYGRIVA